MACDHPRCECMHDPKNCVFQEKNSMASKGQTVCIHGNSPLTCPVCYPVPIPSKPSFGDGFEEWVTNPMHGGKVTCRVCNGFIDGRFKYIKRGDTYEHLDSQGPECRDPSMDKDFLKWEAANAALLDNDSLSKTTVAKMAWIGAWRLLKYGNK